MRPLLVFVLTLNAGPDAKLKPESKQYQGRKRRTHGQHEVKTKTSSGRVCPLPKNYYHFQSKYTTVFVLLDISESK
jgi:hypothetical protein